MVNFYLQGLTLDNLVGSWQASFVFNLGYTFILVQSFCNWFSLGCNQSSLLGHKLRGELHKACQQITDCFLHLFFFHLTVTTVNFLVLTLRGETVPYFVSKVCYLISFLLKYFYKLPLSYHISKYLIVPFTYFLILLHFLVFFLCDTFQLYPSCACFLLRFCQLQFF